LHRFGHGTRLDPRLVTRLHFFRVTVLCTAAAVITVSMVALASCGSPALMGGFEESAPPVG
jgi:hypothetical protein